MGSNAGMAGFTEFVGELRRRAVIQVAAIYAGLAWLVLQFADIAFPRLGLPDWTITFVLVIAALGFPFALIFAWIFERTPDGLKVTGPATEEEVQSFSRSRVADVLVIVVLSILVGLLYADRLLFSTGDSPAILVDAPPAEVEAAPPEPIVDEAPSIAVLPFHNLSTSEENAFFAAGIHEDVLTHLSRIDGLKVISRTSMLRYEGEHNKSMKEIADELGVNHMLEGSVRRSGDQVRITFQLIEATSDIHLWAENYDRKLEDIFAVQSEVARAVAAELKVALTEADEAEVAHVPTENLDAYELFLQAREFLPFYRDPDRAATIFRQIISVDPEFTEAWAGLARSHYNAVPRGAEWKNLREEALNAARTAVELDPLLSDSHAVLGLALTLEQDYPGAMASCRTAVALNANNVEALICLSDINQSLGLYESAADYALQAVTLDPLNEGAHLRVGWNLVEIDPARAVTHAEIVLELNPLNEVAYGIAGQAALVGNDLKSAYDIWSSRLANSDENSVMPALAGMHFFLVGIGAFDTALEYWNRAEAVSPNHEAVYSIKMNQLRAEQTGLPFYEEYLPLAEEWLAHNPDSANAKRWYGDFMNALGDMAESEENLSAAHEFRSKAKTNYEESLAPFKQSDGSYAYQFNSAWAVVHYATLLREMGLEQESVTLMEQILATLESDQSRGNPFARFHRATILGGLGRTDEALDALEDAINHGFHHLWIIEAYHGNSLLPFTNNVRYLQLLDRLRKQNEEVLAYVRAKESQG